MIICRNPSSPLCLPSPVVTTGSFDGVHIGHRAIIERLESIARDIGGTVTLITLYPHPRKVLGLDNEGFYLLSSLEEKERLLEAAGIEVLVELEFTPQFGMLSSDDFVRKIVHGIIGARHVIVGYNHHFGHDRKGDYHSLAAMGRELGFGVSELDKQDMEGEKVSSTTVREALLRGDIATATAYMGHPYLFIGQVDKGVMSVSDPLKLMPPPGYYMTSALNGSTIVEITPQRTILCDMPDGRQSLEIAARI